MSTALTKTEAAHGPPSVHPTVFVHPCATFIDHETVRIGARTRIWQFASVVRGAVLGADCSVASGVTIDGCTFGDGCVISQGVTTCPGLLCENDVFLGPNVSICNDRWPRAGKVGFDIDQFDGSMWAVIIKARASVGARAVVLPGVSIGEGAMIAAGAVVERNIPSGHLLKRDGSIVKIDPRKCLPRMVFARP